MDTEIASVFATFQCTTFPNGLTPILRRTKLDVDLKMYKELYRNYSVLFRDMFTNSFAWRQVIFILTETDFGYLQKSECNISPYANQVQILNAK